MKNLILLSAVLSFLFVGDLQSNPLNSYEAETRSLQLDNPEMILAYTTCCKSGEIKSKNRESGKEYVSRIQNYWNYKANTKRYWKLRKKSAKQTKKDWKKSNKQKRSNSRKNARINRILEGVSNEQIHISFIGFVLVLWISTKPF